MSSPADSTPSPRPDSLRVRLAERGLDVEVEAEGALAVLRLADQSPADLRGLDVRLRGEIVSIARECGFTHVAVELTASPAEREPQESDADLRRAEPLA